MYVCLSVCLLYIVIVKIMFAEYVLFFIYSALLILRITNVAYTGVWVFWATVLHFLVIQHTCFYVSWAIMQRYRNIPRDFVT